MKKKVIRLTESDITRIVKKVLAEQGGYDDLMTMAKHKGIIQGGLKRMIMTIVDIVDQTVSAFEEDLTSGELNNGIKEVRNALDGIEKSLEKIMPELLLNKDLKTAAKNLYTEIKKGRIKLTRITSFGEHLSKYDLNDQITGILLDIGNEADKLAFQVNDEDKEMYRRLGGFSDDM